MFEVLSSKKIFHANKVEIYDCQVKDSLPYVVRMAGNNGIKGYIKENIKFVNPKNTLTFAQDTFIISYQKFDYFTGNNVKILKQNFQYVSENVLKYIVVCLQKAVSPFSWGVGSSFEFIENLKIKIPIKNENLGDDLENIDFKFMEDFIAELEAQRIAELEAYLITTNLKDYNLTTDEKQALKDFENLETKKFKLDELFCIEKTKSFNKNRLTDGNEYDYITRTSLDQGILQQTGFVNKENLNEPKIWSLGLLQMDFFYRQKHWYAGQFVRKIIPKFNSDIDIEIANYFTTLLNNRKSKLLSVLVRNVDETFKKTTIELPTKNGEINYKFMQNFIKAIEKLVIKDVVDFADEKISLTKKCIKTPCETK